MRVGNASIPSTLVKAPDEREVRKKDFFALSDV